MNKIDISNKNLNRIHAITCLEYCYCIIINYFKLDYRYLYFSSFVPTAEILNKIIKTNENYITFDGVGRLHHIGNKLNLLNFSIKEVDLKDLYNYLSKKNNNLPIVAKIEPRNSDEYIEVNGDYSTINNHLVLLIEWSNDTVIYFNPITRELKVVKENIFMKIYDGVIYEFFRSSHNIDINSLSLNGFYGEILNLINNRINMYDYKEIQLILQNKKMLFNIRETAGISKVLSRRLKDYINLYSGLLDESTLLNFNTLLDEKIKSLEKVYTLAEYCRAKDRYIDSIGSIFNNIMKIDESIINLMISIKNTI